MPYILWYGLTLLIQDLNRGTSSFWDISTWVLLKSSYAVIEKFVDIEKYLP